MLGGKVLPRNKLHTFPPLLGSEKGRKPFVGGEVGVEPRESCILEGNIGFLFPPGLCGLGLDIRLGPFFRVHIDYCILPMNDGGKILPFKICLCFDI